jgi:hypothetical protein
MNFSSEQIQVAAYFSALKLNAILMRNHNPLSFEDFTALAMKNDVFWDIKP